MRLDIKKIYFNIYNMVIKYMDVDTDKITANDYKKQLLVKYEDSPFYIQTDWMTLAMYGVPKLDKFHLTEQSRRYIKLSLNNPDFTKFILKLDSHFSSDKFKAKYLTDKQQDFSYIPIYKPGSENYAPFFKVKIVVDDNDNILTETFHKQNDGLEKCVTKNMDDVKKLFSYMCHYRLVFKVSKIWFMSKTYGVQLKLNKAHIEPNEKQVNEADFVESD